jgi:maltose alpha-D-glucosyltransferase/alpha-amylase
VAEAAKDPASLLNTVKSLLKLRHDRAELQAQPNLKILYAEKGKLPFVYRRGSLVIGVNPSGKRVNAPVKAKGRAIYAIGQGALDGETCTLEGQSFVVFED